MAAITHQLPRTRRTRRSLVGRAGALVAEHGPGLVDRARGLAVRVRTAALTLGGLGLVTAAAWEVDSALGKVVAGVSLGVVEYLTGDEGES